MANRPRDLDSEFPIHIRARTNNRQGFPISMDLVWEILCEQLYLARLVHGLRFHSFVLMPNHFHLIARDPELQLSQAMRYFMRQASLQISLRAGRINHLWGSRFKSTVIRNPRYFLHAYKYVYRNPIKAGLCETVLNWPYSTLPFLLGQTKCILPLEFDDCLFNDVTETLKWLQTDFKKDQYEALKAGLRRRELKLRHNKTDRNPNTLHDDESVPLGLRNYRKVTGTF